MTKSILNHLEDGSYEIVEFYKTGEKYRVTHVGEEKGVRVVTHNTFYESGQLRHEKKLYGEDEKKEGPAYRYYENGALEYIYHYRNDIPHGSYAKYDREGNKFDYGRYENGICIPSKRLINKLRKEAQQGTLMGSCIANADEISAAVVELPTSMSLAPETESTKNVNEMVQRSLEARVRPRGSIRFGRRGRLGGGNVPVKIPE